MILLVWLTLALGVNTYARDIPAPDVGLAYSQPDQHIELDRGYVVRFVRRGVRGKQATPELAAAVYVIAHELGHLRCGWTEADADRWARRNWSYVVRLLGGTTPQAWRLWRVLDEGFKR